MNDAFFVIFDQKGVKEMKKKRPKLSGGQFCCKILIEVDDEVFEHSIPTATLKLPKELVRRPPVEVQLTEPHFGKKKGKKTKAI